MCMHFSGSLGLTVKKKNPFQKAVGKIIKKKNLIQGPLVGMCTPTDLNMCLHFSVGVTRDLAPAGSLCIASLGKIHPLDKP